MKKNDAYSLIYCPNIDLKRDLAEDHLLRTEELAQILNVSIKTIRRWRYKGELQGVKIGARLVRYRWGDILAWVNNGQETKRAK